ncbi:hypothetical protein RUND412_006187, partial [Rhizina undulata]
MKAKASIIWVAPMNGVVANSAPGPISNMTSLRHETQPVQYPKDRMDVNGIKQTRGATPLGQNYNTTTENQQRQKGSRAQLRGKRKSYRAGRIGGILVGEV